MEEDWKHLNGDFCEETLGVRTYTDVQNPDRFKQVVSDVIKIIYAKTRPDRPRNIPTYESDEAIVTEKIMDENDDILDTYWDNLSKRCLDKNSTDQSLVKERIMLGRLSIAGKDFLDIESGLFLIDDLAGIHLSHVNIGPGICEELICKIKLEEEHENKYINYVRRIVKSDFLTTLNCTFFKVINVALSMVFAIKDFFF